MSNNLGGLSTRFGTPAHYEDSFREMVDRSQIGDDFKEFNASKTKADKYEVSRQQFLRLLGEGKMIWHRTNEEHDLDCEISRIYRRDKREYLAFMRLQPCGFRGERLVPANNEMVFHVLFGSVLFVNKSRVRTLVRGSSTTVSPKTTYSIKNSSHDEPAYLIFRILNNNNK